MKKEAISHQVKALTFTLGLGIGAKNEQAAFWARNHTNHTAESSSFWHFT